MSTKQNAKSNQSPVEPKSLFSMDAITDAMKSPEMLQQLLDQLKPLIESQKAAESENNYDVTIHWNVVAMRGKDTVFAKNCGTSTMPYMLGLITMAEAPSKIDHEITNKIVNPFVARFQEYVNKVALEHRAKTEAASGLDDQMNDDLP